MTNQSPIPLSDESIRSLENRILNLEAALRAVHERNIDVETNKSWETSTTRFLAIALITYCTMVLILWSIGGPFPPVHALVPTCGYILSTLSLQGVKKLWLRAKTKPGASL